MYWIKKELYEAMVMFLDSYYWKNPSDGLGILLGIINLDMMKDGNPIDPVVVKEWNTIVENNKNAAGNVGDGFDMMICFLEYYANEVGFELQEVISDLKKQRKMYERIYMDQVQLLKQKTFFLK